MPNRAEARETNCDSCYHCGDDLPQDADFALEIDGISRPMCCPGCRAVAGLIVASGLERFYDQRTAFNPHPETTANTKTDTFLIYDDPALLEQYSEHLPEGGVRLRLLVGGLSCAACTWLIERTLLQHAAIDQATLNLHMNRLDVTLRDDSLRPSDVLARVAALGYSVQPWHSASRREQARAEQREDLRRLAVAGLGMMQVGMFAIALHAGDVQGMDEEYRGLMRWVSLAITSFIVVFSARGFFESALRHLRAGALVMDLPVSLAIGLAWFASALATVRGGGEVYFDSVVMCTFLLLLARFVEKRLRYRDVMAWQGAQSLLPQAVRVFRDGRWALEPRALLRKGDLVLARAGEMVPIDGSIESGCSSVREDTLNGETLPRSVEPGSPVFAGTVNLNDSLEVRASGSYAQTRLAALQRSIDTAQVQKPRLAHLADRIAGHFIAGILLVTAATALYWWQVDPDRAFWIALSVLVVSCPCALSLATPATLASAVAALRSRGVIVHGENALETLPRCTHMLFDKTGTISSGNFRVARVLGLNSHLSDSEVLGLAAALQQHANHPIAAAFRQIEATKSVSNVQFIAGKGLEGSLDGSPIRIGSTAFCRELCPAFPDSPLDALYWVGLCNENGPIAYIGFEDELRPETHEVLSALRDRGVIVELLTGDASEHAMAIAHGLGFSHAQTGQSPEDKRRYVALLQQQGAVVGMVGDGLNDAPVLTQADTSIAVAGATDLARAQADFVLLEGDLSQISLLTETARRTRRVVIQNFAWALGYNAVGIPLAALGWVPPWAAAIGMSLSSLLVVTNALRLRHF
jgi:Cu2+-exporting ATPase